MKIRLGRDTKLPDRACPVCNNKLDAASAINADTSPQPGDVSICFYCGSFLIYSDDMSSRLLTELEVYALDPHTKALLVETRQRLKQYRQEKDKR